MIAEQVLSEKMDQAKKDWYWYNICDTALQLHAQGLGQAKYVTQFASGKCEWETELGNSVIIAPSGQFPSCLKG